VPAVRTDAAVRVTFASISESAAGWANNCGFAPDPLRAARLDQAVREGLCDSLETIFDSLDPPIAAADPRRVSLLQFIRAGRAPPRLFGVYVDLVLALFGERSDDARALIAELFGQSQVGLDGLRIVTLDDATLGEGQSARYRRLLSGDIHCEIDALGQAALVDAAERFTQAICLLEAGAPDVFDEFHALIREVVLVTPGAGPEGFIFGGASTFSLWGAVVLNAGALSDRLDAAVSIAHEAAHSHLFGLALGGRLVENDDAERYPSPLRHDKRPMEGVAHATYVTARMSYALRSLVESGQLNESERGRARDQLSRNQKVYQQGLETVLSHARLTPVGAAAFERLRQHMDGP
jgi:hypothetical protein